MKTQQKSNCPGRKNPRIFRAFFLLSVLLCGISVSTSLFADRPREPQPPPPQDEIAVLREIYVPEDRLDAVFEAAVNRMVLQRDEYETLREKARQAAEAQWEKSREPKPPVGAVVLASDFTIRVVDRRALFDGTLEVDVLHDRPVALPLPSTNVRILTATLDGKPAPLDPENAVLDLAGKGRKTVTLHLVSPLETDATRQELRFAIPPAPRERTVLEVPGDVELRSGAAVIDRRVEGEGENRKTRFELLLQPDDGLNRLVLTLNSHKTRRQRTVIARSIQFAEVAETYQRLRATFSFDVKHQGVERLAVAIPEGFEVTDVHAPQLKQWTIRSGAEFPEKSYENDANILLMEFREAMTGPVPVSLTAVRVPFDPVSAEWSMPRFEPLDVASHAAVLGLLLDTRLRMGELTATRFVTIPFQTLALMLPDSVFATVPGSPVFRGIATWYAPCGSGSAVATYRLPEARVDVDSHFELALSQDGQTLQGTVTLTPRGRRIFEAIIEIPTHCRILALHDSVGKSLSCEPVETSGNGKTGSDTSANETLPSRDRPGIRRFKVRLPDSAPLDEPYPLLLHAAVDTKGWFDDWEEIRVDFPRLTVVSPQPLSDTGFFVVRKAGQRDYDVTTEEALRLFPPAADDGTVPVYDDIACRLQYFDPDPRLSVQVRKSRSRSKATVVSFCRFEPALLRLRYEIAYTVEEARTDRLRFSIPPELPPMPQISGLDGLAIKEHFSTEKDGRRYFDVRLRDPQRGLLRLAVETELPLSLPTTPLRGDGTAEETPGTLAATTPLPLLRAEDVAWQSAFVSVEGDEELELDVLVPRSNEAHSAEGEDAADIGKNSATKNSETTVNVERARAVDVGELSHCVYHPGKRLLGAWKIPADDTSPISVRYHRVAPYATVGVLVDTLQADVFLGEGRRALVRAVYTLRAKPVTLALAMEDGDRLWTMDLDGEPLKPQHSGTEMLVVIPPVGSRQERVLTVLYDTEIPVETGDSPDIPASLHGRSIVLRLPVMRFPTRADEGRPQTLPVAKIRWNLVPPNGKRIVRIGDHAPGIFTPKPAIFRLAEVVRLRIAREFSGQTYYVTLSDTAIVDTAEQAIREFDTEFVMGEKLYFSRESLAKSSASDEGKPLSKKEADKSENLSKSKLGTLRSLRSVRPVSINIDNPTMRTGNPVSHAALGSFGAQELEITLRDADLRPISFHVGFWGFLLLGLMTLAWTARSRWTTLLLLIFLATLAALVPGWESCIGFFDGLAYAALLALLPIFLLVDCVRGLYRGCCRNRNKENAATTPTVPTAATSFTTGFSPKPKSRPPFLLALILFTVPSLTVPSLTVSTLRAEDTTDKGPPLDLPGDAIIIPYDPHKVDPTRLPTVEDIRRDDGKIFVPLEQWKRLREWVDPRQGDDSGTSQGPKLTLSGLVYETNLDAADRLNIRGRFLLKSRDDETVALPLSVEGGVFTEITVGGKAADLDKNGLVVHGKGEHEVRFTLQFPVRRQGGWRSVQGVLPSAAACEIRVVLPEAGTDLLGGNPLDQRKWTANRAGETVKTSTDAQGRFHWQWRTKIEEGEIDHALKVQSEAAFEVREDGYRLTWDADLAIGRGRREMFRFRLPADYIILAVTGDNVRGFTDAETAAGDGASGDGAVGDGGAGENDADTDRVHLIDVELLKPAEGTEHIRLVLFKPSDVQEGAATEMEGAKKSGQTSRVRAPGVPVPRVDIPGAAIHRGRLCVLRSPLLHVRTEVESGLQLTDLPAETELAPGDGTPFKSVQLQAFRFTSPDYELRAHVFAPRSKTHGEIRTILRLSEHAMRLETQVRLSRPDGRLFYGDILLPENFEVIKVALGKDLPFEWSLVEKEDGRHLLVFLPEGGEGGVPVLIEGAIPVETGLPLHEDGVGLPCLRLCDVESGPTYLAIMADPVYDVVCRDLAGIRSEPGASSSWITEASQRRLVRTLLSGESWKTYSGTVRLRPRKSELWCDSVTNVRLIGDAIEETILFDFNIGGAGVRDIVFDLLPWQSDAKIETPLLRQKTFEPLPSPAPGLPSPGVRVHLELQEAVLGPLKVLVSCDRPIKAAQRQQVRVPVVQGARIGRQYIVFEQAGSLDQLKVLPTTARHGLEKVSRGQKEWAYLGTLLGDRIIEAYVSTQRERPGLPMSQNEDDTAGTGTAPVALAASPNDTVSRSGLLEYEMIRRETVALSDARIGLAETALSVGDGGVWRMEQVYRIDNKTQPYLDLLLPPTGELWSAWIYTAEEWNHRTREPQTEVRSQLGQPVRPGLMPETLCENYRKGAKLDTVTDLKTADTSRFVRIPIVKTELGDLDYVLRLACAGTGAPLRNFHKRQMPAIRVLNMTVDRQALRLFLPERFDYRFDGSFHRVARGGEHSALEQLRRDYDWQQANALEKAILQTSNPFASQRAYRNSSQLDNEAGEMFRKKLDRQQRQMDGQGFAFQGGPQQQIVLGLAFEPVPVSPYAPPSAGPQGYPQRPASAVHTRGDEWQGEGQQQPVQTQLNQPIPPQVMQQQFSRGAQMQHNQPGIQFRGNRAQMEDVVRNQQLDFASNVVNQSGQNWAPVAEGRPAKGVVQGAAESGYDGSTIVGQGWIEKSGSGVEELSRQRSSSRRLGFDSGSKDAAPQSGESFGNNFLGDTVVFTDAERLLREEKSLEENRENIGNLTLSGNVEFGMQDGKIHVDDDVSGLSSTSSPFGVSGALGSKDGRESGDRGGGMGGGMASGGAIYTVPQTDAQGETRKSDIAAGKPLSETPRSVVTSGTVSAMEPAPPARPASTFESSFTPAPGFSAMPTKPAPAAPAQPAGPGATSATGMLGRLTFEAPAPTSSPVPVHTAPTVPSGLEESEELFDVAVEGRTDVSSSMLDLNGPGAVTVFGGREGVPVIKETPAPATLATRFTSLDIDVPLEGREYVFSSTGVLNLEAYCYDATLPSRLYYLVWTLALFVPIGLVVRFLRRRAAKTQIAT